MMVACGVSGLDVQLWSSSLVILIAALKCSMGQMSLGHGNHSVGCQALPTLSGLLRSHR